MDGVMYMYVSVGIWMLCFLGVSSGPRLVLINVLLTLAHGIEWVILVLRMPVGSGCSEILLWYHAAASYGVKSHPCHHTSVIIRESMLCRWEGMPHFSVRFVQFAPI